VQVVVKVMG